MIDVEMNKLHKKINVLVHPPLPPKSTHQKKTADASGLCDEEPF